MKKISAEYKDIFNNMNIKNWFKQLALEEPIIFSILIGNNIENFNRLFGEAEGVEDGIYYWTWVEQGMYFILTTSKSGTNYFVRYFESKENLENEFENDTQISIFLISFLNSIIDRLSVS
jgi:hypothetical protein